MAKYEKLFREEVKNGAIHLHLKDLFMKKTERMEKAAAALPKELHTPHMLDDEV
jgi:hypothetical protein